VVDQSPAVDEPRQREPAAVVVQPATPTDGPVRHAQSDTDPPPPVPAREQPPTFDPEPFRRPVGEDGWTLWLASAPEPEVAEREVARFERRGLVAAYRAVDLGEKGTWYRIYTGSFPTRAAAREAVAGLRAELKHEWVVPSRF
jgi:septal ring-binding cell division protein DamX